MMKKESRDILVSNVIYSTIEMLFAKASYVVVEYLHIPIKLINFSFSGIHGNPEDYPHILSLFIRDMKFGFISTRRTLDRQTKENCTDIVFLFRQINVGHVKNVCVK